MSMFLNNYSVPSVVDLDTDLFHVDLDTDCGSEQLSVFFGLDIYQMKFDKQVCFFD